MTGRDTNATDEQIRKMNAKLAAEKGFGEEEAFDGREALHDEGDAVKDPAAATDEQIREMNATFAAHEGFVAEEDFDEREAEHDAGE